MSTVFTFVFDACFESMDLLLLNLQVHPLSVPTIENIYLSSTEGEWKLHKRSHTRKKCQDHGGETVKEHAGSLFLMIRVHPHPSGSEKNPTDTFLIHSIHGSDEFFIT